MVAPTARCTTATARSRGPSLRADASKRSSSASVSPTRISPSSTPTVAGTAPPSRTARSDARPTSTPSPGGNPCAISVVSSATTPRCSRSACATSSETITASLRAGRSSVRPLPGRARRRRPESRRPARRRPPSCRRPPLPLPGSRGRPRSVRSRPRLSTQRVSSSPTAARSRSVANTTSGASSRRRARNGSSTSDHVETSTATIPFWRRVERAASTAAAEIGSRRSEYPDTCSTSQSNHDSSRSCGARSGALPRSDAIVRSPSDAIETTTPVLPETGPTTWTP